MINRLRLTSPLAGAALLGLCAFAAPPAFGQSAIPSRASDPAVARLQERIDQLELQVRRLTGDNERLSFELQSMNDRLTRLENRAVGQADPAGGFAGNGRGGGALAEPATALDAETELNNAFSKLDRGDYPGAEAAFAAFLSGRPQDARRPEALYWYGQTLLAGRSNTQAARQFIDIRTNYADAAVAPAALAYLGVALAKMGDVTNACLAFRDFRTEYGSGPERRGAATRNVSLAELRAVVSRESTLAGCR